MTVKMFHAGPLGTNCYLLSNEETKEAVIVDPGGCPANLKEEVRRDGLAVQAILLTHAHFDHIMGIGDALAAFGKMPVYVHEQDMPMLRDPEQNLSAGYGMDFRYTEAEPVTDGQILSLMGLEFAVIHTPGHTPGGVCYYVESEGILFSGDTLFQGSVGRTDFPGGSSSQLIRSVREKLFLLPDDTRVCPGHMETTAIWYEKTHNPFV